MVLENGKPRSRGLKTVSGLVSFLSNGHKLVFRGEGLLILKMSAEIDLLSIFETFFLIND